MLGDTMTMERALWWSRHYGLPVHLIDREGARVSTDMEADAVLGRIITGGGR